MSPPVREPSVTGHVYRFDTRLSAAAYLASYLAWLPLLVAAIVTRATAWVALAVLVAIASIVVNQLFLARAASAGGSRNPFFTAVIFKEGRAPLIAAALRLRDPDGQSSHG